jgi:mono/diheme cytochrome c family protein
VRVVYSRASRGLLALACLTAVACKDNAGAGRPQLEDDAGPAVRSEPINYQRDLRAVIESNCVECHKPGGIGPMPLDSWENVQAVGPAIVSAVSAGRMPPWPADDSCRPIVDARALPAETRALFTRWQADGFTRGDEADYVAPEPRRRLELGEPSLMLAGDAPFTPALQADTYRCFYVGSVEDDTYLTALDIVPEIGSEVHHVQLHRVDEKDVAAVQAMQDQDETGGYACSSAGVGGSVSSQNMFSYRPGSLAVLFNEGDAAYLKRGSGLVLQIHYNTQFLPHGEEPRPDLTKVAMWTLPAGSSPNYVIYRTGVLSPLNGVNSGEPFAFLSASIPPDEANVVGESTVPMQNVSQLGAGLSAGLSASGAYIPGQIVGITPHAHAWATRMVANIQRADGSESCLVEVPDWDYGWQLDYLFEEGLDYAADDMLHVECHYDNTADNQPLVNGERRQPQTITFGENTLNEMCLHYLWLRFKYDDFVAATPP